MTTMKDFNGEPLYVGDAIATTMSGYSDLQLMYVYGFTKQKVKLSRHKTLEPDNYCNITKFSNQVAKIVQ